MVQTVTIEYVECRFQEDLYTKGLGPMEGHQAPVRRRLSCYCLLGLGHHLVIVSMTVPCRMFGTCGYPIIVLRACDKNIKSSSLANIVISFRPFEMPFRLTRYRSRIIFSFVIHNSLYLYTYINF